MAGLLDLPNEILLHLPQHMEIEDFANTACTCRRLREVFKMTSPNDILHLAASSTLTLFQPRPWLLVLGTARQVSDWAIGNAERTEELVEAFSGGVEGLFQLALRVAGLTLADIHRLHLARYNVINPLNDKIRTIFAPPPGKEQQVHAFIQTRHFDLIAFQMIIYGELFGSTMRSFLEPERALPRFGINIRIKYIKYVKTYIPYYREPERTDGGVPMPPTERNRAVIGNQHIIKILYMHSEWRRAWEDIVHRVAPNFEGGGDYWRQDLYWRALTQVGGLKGMEMVAKGLDKDSEVPAAWREMILEVRDSVAALDVEKHRPGYVILSKQRFMRYQHVSKAPDYNSELSAYCGNLRQHLNGIWMGWCRDR